MSETKAPLRPGRNLDYPYDTRPELGATIEIAPGVHWVRMRLPMQLNHINVWLLEDGEGWTIVDTGIRDQTTKDAWKTLFAGVMGGRALARVIVTHLHPDHVGLAGWLVRKFDVKLWMSRTDYLLCRTLVADTGQEAPPEGIRFYKAAGFSEEALDTYKTRFGGFGLGVHKLPSSYRRIVDGEEIKIGKRVWTVVVGRGHAPEHACLWCKDANIIISGDQILPRISSNVSLFPTEPDANPLQDWLEFLRASARSVARRYSGAAIAQRAVSRRAVAPAGTDRRSRSEYGKAAGVVRGAEARGGCFPRVVPRQDHQRKFRHGDGREPCTSELSYRARAHCAHDRCGWCGLV